MNLEQLAKEMFERFALRETGRQASWHYLNRNRQIAWMLEVLEIADAVMLKIRDNIKPVPILSPINTTFSVGFNAGIKQERAVLIQQFENIHLDLLEQLNSAVPTPDLKLSKNDRR